MNLFAELKRRHVYRVAAAYAVVGWLLIEVASTIIPALHLPDSLTTVIVVLVLLGFPVAVLLAWAFEVTPEGVRRTGVVPQGSQQRRPIPWWQKSLGVVVVAALMFGGWWAFRPAPAVYDSIAVLPFADSSAGQQGDYFGDGLAEELLNALGNVPTLRVAARTSAFSFKGKDADVREIAAKLGVATVLEGSVRRGDGRVRINAQLIDAATGFQIWHGDYERSDSDLFALQNQMAREIVDAMSIKLGVAEKSRLVRGGTQDAKAYDLYLKGRQRWVGRQVPELWKAADEMRQAVRIDPGFALAWSGLSDVIDALAWRDPKAVPLVPEGRSAALRALSLTPDLPEAWASMGIIVGEFDHDYDTAEHALEHAIRLRPSYAQALIWRADISRYQGHIDVSLDMYARSVKADPLAAQFKQNYATQLARYNKDPARALTLLREVLAADPEQPEALARMAVALNLPIDAAERATYARRWAASIGVREPERAELLVRAMYDKTQRPAALRLLDGIRSEIGWNEFLPDFAAILGDRERTLALLEEGQASHVGSVLGIGVSPVYAFVADDPRFQAIVAAQGLLIAMPKQGKPQQAKP